jgi:hypothetical protein
VPTNCILSGIYFCNNIIIGNFLQDHLCGLVVRVPGYSSRGPGSIHAATRFSEKQWVWNGVHSASWVQQRSYLKEKVAAPVKKPENMAVGIRHADNVTSSISKRWHQFRRQAEVARSVWLARGLRQRSFFSYAVGVSGRLVDWGIMPQAGKSWVQFPKKLVNSFN